jgi:hypothetical protein
VAAAVAGAAALLCLGSGTAASAEPLAVTPGTALVTAPAEIAPDDVTPPTFDNDVPELGESGWLLMSGSVLVRADDDGGVVWLETRQRLDGGAWSEWLRVERSRTDVGVETSGHHELEFRAADTAGNVGSGSLAIDADFETPTIAVLAPALREGIVHAADLFTVGQEVPFEVECVDATSGIASCDATLDGVPVGDTLPTEEPYGHTISILATDVAGNQVVETFEYSVDDGLAPEPVGSGDGDPGQPAGPGDGQPDAAHDSAADPAAEGSQLADTGAVIVWPWVLLVGGIFAAGVLLIGSTQPPAHRSSRRR